MALEIKLKISDKFQKIVFGYNFLMKYRMNLMGFPKFFTIYVVFNILIENYWKNASVTTIK